MLTHKAKRPSPSASISNPAESKSQETKAKTPKAGGASNRDSGMGGFLSAFLRQASGSAPKIRRTHTGPKRSFRQERAARLARLRRLDAMSESGGAPKHDGLAKPGEATSRTKSKQRGADGFQKLIISKSDSETFNTAEPTTKTLDDSPASQNRTDTGVQVQETKKDLDTTRITVLREDVHAEPQSDSTIFPNNGCASFERKAG